MNEILVSRAGKPITDGRRFILLACSGGNRSSGKSMSSMKMNSALRYREWVGQRAMEGNFSFA